MEVMEVFLKIKIIKYCVVLQVRIYTKNLCGATFGATNK